MHIYNYIICIYIIYIYYIYVYVYIQVSFSLLKHFLFGFIWKRTVKNHLSQTSKWSMFIAIVMSLAPKHES